MVLVAKPEGIGSTRTDIGVGIRGIIVEIERKSLHLGAIVRVACNKGHTPAGKTELSLGES